ncbi:cysteine desulfurase family protein [Chitinophaga barathri]|uniref:cysteine desulfurase n=1 Tax=Chitinophaga barathri TaxID=1647451 RepID=A0A3N4MW09_9BACT|nr:cysteine desulfurase family protein [Chitinophaga barathri]RPD39583.1 cysteine desulfurase [Chitinophaga barathri]
MSATPIYLDYNATTPLDERVLEAMLPFFKTHFANAGSAHLFGLSVREAVESAGEQLAGLIGASPDNILHTSGATESVNLALKGIHSAERNHIVTIATEHKAVLDTCVYLEQQGYRITVISAGKDGSVNEEDLLHAVTDETLCVCTMLANNETGVIHPIPRFSDIAHARGALMLCDATQAVGKIPVNVHELGVDLMPLSAHKFYGPKGSGALFISPGIRRKFSAQMHGGGHQKGLRSGTLNVPGIIGIGKAAEIAGTDMAGDSRRIGALRDQLEQELLSIQDTSRNGHPEQRLYNTTNICFPGVNADQLILALQHISVSSGSACTAATTYPSHVLKSMGLSDQDALSSIRFSLGRFTTGPEIEQTIGRLKLLISRFRG